MKATSNVGWLLVVFVLATLFTLTMITAKQSLIHETLEANAANLFE